MELERAIYSRRSVRDFTEQPVDEATIRRPIDAAIQAPSAMGEEPWAFSVVRDPVVLARISEAAKQHALDATGESAPPEGLKAMLEHPDFDILYHAPALIVISGLTATPWAVIDCALAAQNLMLTARDSGLGSCWIGLAGGWLATPEGKAAIEAPEGARPIAPIIVGYPASQPGPVARKAPEINWVGGLAGRSTDRPSS